MSFVSFKSVLALATLVCSVLGGERLYTISVTTGSSQSDETSNPVYFRIFGIDGRMTDWFKYNSFPQRNTKYEFTRCLDDVGQIEKIQAIRKNSDHIVMSQISVDNLIYNFPSRIRIGCCCYQLEVNFNTQTHTYSSMSSSYCNNVNSDIIAYTVCSTNSPTLFPTNIPTEGESSCDYTHTCEAWGDPHITTFDNTNYHFQGEGYFDYVTSCPGSNLLLPFIISAKHIKCNGDYTCVDEVIIQLLTELYKHKTTLILSNGGNINISPGTYIFGDINGYDTSYTVSNKDGYAIIEINFIINDGTSTKSKILIKYRETRLVIESTDCLFGNNYKCGLCGNINNNNEDDFIRCDNGNKITTYESDGYDEPAWTNVHNFGESCCNKDLDLTYLYETDCQDSVVIPPKPSSYCINNAKEICRESYEKYCMDCVLFNEANNRFLQSCAIDVCALCDDNIVEAGFEEVLSAGCLDTSINQCVWKRLDEISHILF